jgi:hypothetical protein
LVTKSYFFKRECCKIMGFRNERRPDRGSGSFQCRGLWHFPMKCYKNGELEAKVRGQEDCAAKQDPV